MLSERENIYEESGYGVLLKHTYKISGNLISAFYDKNNQLIFVLDETITERKPNVLLIINSDGNRKWDEILSGEYGVDLETIRPKADNKYQKLDIEYSGLSVYENLIKCFVEHIDFSEQLIQLDVLRDSAVRHSAMDRLSMSNDIISKTNATIVKTKETIVRLHEKIKVLKEKLKAQRKEIGKVAPKQSAAKILKLESQIESANEKLKRAEKRLDNAYRRLEIATVDAELASNLLNQPALDVPVVEKNKSDFVIENVNNVEHHSYDDDDYDEEVVSEQKNEEEIKPLFTEMPDFIKDENEAFKPVNYDVSSEYTEDVNNEFENNFDSQSEQVLQDKSDFVENLNTNSVQNIPEMGDTEKGDASFTPVEFNDLSFNDDYSELLDDTKKDTEDSTDRDIPEIETLTPVIEQPQEEFSPINVRPVTQEEAVEEVSGNTTNSGVNNEITSAVEYKDNTQPVPVNNEINAVSNGINVALERKDFIQNNNADEFRKKANNKLYYVLLIVLIVLSIFTLWLYQKNMNTNTPVLTGKVATTELVDSEKDFSVETNDEELLTVSQEDSDTVVAQDTEKVFLDNDNNDVFVDNTLEPISENVIEPQYGEEEIEDTIFLDDEISAEEESENITEAPSIINDVPAMVNSVTTMEEEEPTVVNGSVDRKPVYEVGLKEDDIFIRNEDSSEESYYDEEDVFLDE